MKGRMNWIALNRRRPLVAAAVSEWGSTVKMSRVFHRNRGRQRREGDDRGDQLTSCCWSVCPVRRSCNFPAVCWSGVTGPHRSHLRSPRQSFHQTDPGPRLRCCASAGHKRRTRLNQGRKNLKIGIACYMQETQDLQNIYIYIYKCSSTINQALIVLEEKGKH